MLSGIGPKEELDKWNIPVLKEAQVGYNLQDHVSVVKKCKCVNLLYICLLRVDNFTRKK